MELTNDIVTATKEIFETMVMLDVADKPPLAKQVIHFENSISGMVGLAGTHKGMLSIHTPYDVAKVITANFLGMEVDEILEIDEDVEDAIGEVANMLAGSVKLALSAQGKDITLSIPTAIHGTDYTINCMDDAEFSIVPFTIEGLPPFLIELQLKKTEE